MKSFSFFPFFPAKWSLPFLKSFSLCETVSLFVSKIFLSSATEEEASILLFRLSSVFKSSIVSEAVRTFFLGHGSSSSSLIKSSLPSDDLTPFWSELLIHVSFSFFVREASSLLGFFLFLFFLPSEVILTGWLVTPDCSFGFTSFSELWLFGCRFFFLRFLGVECDSFFSGSGGKRLRFRGSVWSRGSTTSTGDALCTDKGDACGVTTDGSRSIRLFKFSGSSLFPPQWNLTAFALHPLSWGFLQGFPWVGPRSLCLLCFPGPKERKSFKFALKRGEIFFVTYFWFPRGLVNLFLMGLWCSLCFEAISTSLSVRMFCL